MRQSSIRLKDGAGLTLNQKRLLSCLVFHGDLGRAAEDAGVAPSTARYWLGCNRAFKAAVNELFTKPLVAQTGAKLASILPNVGNVLDEGIHANQPVHHSVTCPECAHQFTVVVQAPEWPTRLRATEVLLRVHGLGQTSRLEVEGEIKHKLSLSLEDRLALAKYRRGQALPPGLEESLRDRGLLQEGTTEGEFREVDEEPEEAS